jgi:hypothetical protein
LGATFCLLIWCFMHVQSVLRLIITLFMIEWLKIRYRFASYPSKINWLMFLLSRSFTLCLPIYSSSFMWATHLQFDGTMECVVI